MRAEPPGQHQNTLDAMTQEANSLGIVVDFSILKKLDDLDGLFIEWNFGSIILINSTRPLQVQVIALAEELGHFHKSSGNIISQNNVQNRKSENAGRGWSYSRLLPPDIIKFAVKSGMCAPYELAERFNFDESFIVDAIMYYERKGIIPTACGWCSVG